MMLVELVVISHPIELPEEGIDVHEFTPLCVAIENYLKNVRLPDHLRALKFRIKARLVEIEGRTTMQLRLLHDGQLPLPFSVSKKDRRPAPALLDELQHIKDTIHAALVRSNTVWATAARIINEVDNPAEEIGHIQEMTGFHAPRRPASKYVPASLTLVAADKQLSIESIDIRPEYTETQAQVFKLLPRMASQGMVFKVLSVRNANPGSEFESQAQIGQDLKPRWPLVENLAWHTYAGIGVLLEEPVEAIGFTVVSTETLAAKAIQILQFDIQGALIKRLMDSVNKVKAFEAKGNNIG